MGGRQSIQKEANETDFNEGPVVIGVDFSVHSKRAFEWYVTNKDAVSSDPNRTVILVHCKDIVTAAQDPLYSGGSRHVMDMTHHEEVHERVKNASLRLQEKFLTQCRENNLKCQWMEGFGEAGRVILEETKEARADLVIVGTRGETRLRRTIMGSVSDYVLHHSNIPVIVIPPPPKVKKDKPAEPDAS